MNAPTVNSLRLSAHTLAYKKVIDDMRTMRESVKKDPMRPNELYDKVIAIELFGCATGKARQSSKSGKRSRVGVELEFEDMKHVVRLQIDSKPQSGRNVPERRKYEDHFRSAWNRLGRLIDT